MKVAIALLLAIAGASPALCAEFPTRMHPVDADVSVCFTPGENCQSEIVQAINGAEKQIRVQAYGFTSLPILQALQQAISRGVDVELALDKSDAFGKDKQPKLDGPAASMVAAGAKVWIDDHPGIAHNKVIVIDGWETIGGSFNYTKSAATRNRENVTFISSPDIASAFLANWEARRAVSEPFVFTSPQGLQ